MRAAAEDSSQSRVSDHLEELRQERKAGTREFSTSSRSSLVLAVDVV